MLQPHFWVNVEVRSHSSNDFDIVVLPHVLCNISYQEQRSWTCLLDLDGFVGF